MFKSIRIIETDRANFALLFNDERIPQIQHAVAQGGIHIQPRSGHSIVTLELVCERVTVEQRDTATDEAGR